MSLAIVRLAIALTATSFLFGSADNFTAFDIDDTSFACGRIPANRVFDIQWSGNENNSVQACSGFNAPFDPRSGRLTVDLTSDHFRLVKLPGDEYDLLQFGKSGEAKGSLRGGKLSLGNLDVLFFIIDGWYGTIITRSSNHNYGDQQLFESLRSNPIVSCNNSDALRDDDADKDHSTSANTSMSTSTDASATANSGASTNSSSNASTRTNHLTLHVVAGFLCAALLGALSLFTVLRLKQSAVVPEQKVACPNKGKVVTDLSFV